MTGRDFVQGCGRIVLWVVEAARAHPRLAILIEGVIAGYLLRWFTS
ncbi:MAG TPA: hypothetical protein VI229_00325 [Burkholderiales bacterium]